MPTAPTHWTARPISAADSGFDNHTSEDDAANGSTARRQRFQISTITTVAAASNPTNRIMIVPTLCCDRRSGIGSVLSGRTLCIDVPRNAQPRRCGTGPWSRPRRLKFKSNSITPGGCDISATGPAIETAQIKPPHSISGGGGCQFYNSSKGVSCCAARRRPASTA